MNYLVLLLVLVSCQTTKETPPPQDRLQGDLSAYVTKCACEIKEGLELQSWNIAWNDNEKLKQQIVGCQCTMDFTINDVKEPLKYIKPGTSFYQLVQGNPWDKDYKRLEKVE